MKNVPAIGLFVVLCSAAFACGGENPAPVAPGPVARGPAVRSCARVRDAGRTPVPVALTRTGSTVALARQGDKTYAYVADEDDQAVHVVDVEAGKDVAATPLGSRPAQLMFLADGRLAVALRDKGEVAVLEPDENPAAPLEARCSISTDAEPWGLALSPDDAHLYVSSAWGHSMGSFDAKAPQMTKQWTVSLPREPRSIVVSDDGSKVFVAQAVGSVVSVVDVEMQRVTPLSTSHSKENVERAQKLTKDSGVTVALGQSQGVRRAACQGFALAKTADPGGRVLLPQVLVDPGDPESRPTGYGSPGIDETEVADVAVLDEKSGEVFLPSLQAADDRVQRMMSNDAAHDHGECLLPRAATYEPKSKGLLVTCFGIDALVEYDALAASPTRTERRRWTVAPGADGVAVDTAKDRAVVWSQFERVVDVVSLAGPDLVDEHGAQKPADPTRIALTPTTKGPSMAMALGRVLFHTSGDSRISHDGRACASCHPDGRDDSLTWATPNGPRRSIMLSGRVADTAPFSWSGSEHTLQQHLTVTFSRLKGVGGLKSLELDALVAYVEALPTPPPPASAQGELAAKVARGHAIFTSEAAGCSGCHAGGIATDNEHHDVQSKGTFDNAPTFNTPSLKFVGGGGPYFHDGRYKTLHELLTDSDRKMGHTAQLSTDDLESLEAYLRSL
jgi:DNA-binding beta-propeller fold protein YncE